MASKGSEVDQVYNFLRQRDVDLKICDNFRNEKMDFTVIKLAKDEELQSLGLLKRGDILALRGFVESNGQARNDERDEKKRKLLEVLKAKLPRKKNKSNAKAEKTTEVKEDSRVTHRKVLIGWQHFDQVKNKYVAVRMSKGGGTREISLPINSAKTNIIEQMVHVFFPDGKSVFGYAFQMKKMLCNFKLEEITDADFTLANYIKLHKLSKVRLYLFTKSVNNFENIFESSDSDEDLHPAIEEHGQTSSLVESALDRSSLCQQQNMEHHQSLEKDREKNYMKRKEHQSLQEKLEDEYNLRQARKAKIEPNDSEEDLPHAFDEHGQMSSLIGSTLERNNLLQQQNMEYHQSLAKDQDKDEMKTKEHQSIQEKLQEEYNLHQARKAKVVDQPDIKDPHVTVSVRHLTLGVQTRRFPVSCLISSIYDWVGSLSVYPAHFTLSSCDVPNMDPSLSVTLVDRVLVNMAATDETTMLSELNMNISSVNHCNINDFDNIYDIPPPILLEEDEIPSETMIIDHIETVDISENEGSNQLNNQNTRPSETIVIDHIETATATGNEWPNQLNNQNVRVLKVRRVNVMKDMMEEFKDDSIMQIHIKVVMINSFGKEELGMDDGGVLRDVLSAFWSSFYDSCTVGEDERVPVVRHDFKDEEWEAVARVLLKGYHEVKFFPVKLNKVFMFSILFESQQIPDELLMESFLGYVSKDERDLINTALKCDLGKKQEEEWHDFLERFDCRTNPTKEKRQTVILELAHKEMVQVAQFIIDSWRKPFKVYVKRCGVFTSLESLEKLYADARPTVRRVLSLIHAEPESNAQRAVVSFLKRYIRGLDDDKLSKFLRYCTGSTMICVESIKVSFTDLDGAARRPVAHTCGSVLELPTTYQSFPQFREEMNNIFSSEYWDIDIA